MQDSCHTGCIKDPAGVNKVRSKPETEVRGLCYATRCYQQAEKTF